MEILKNNSEQNSLNTSYYVLNKDVEVCNNYFDLVPDGNLYTMDDMPIFAIRMRAMGIYHIMNMYERKYGFHTDVLTYKIHSHQYSLYSADTLQMYNTQKDVLLKYFDFSKSKINDFNGIIIVVINEDERMIHAIPYIYGVQDGRKKIIFLDPFYSADMGSGCIVGANFFYHAYNGDIDCYCHGQTVQADHHSCGIIACDFVKNCLQHKAKVVKKIFRSVNMRVEINDGISEKNSYINVYELPTELRRFTQVKHNKAFEASVADTGNEQEKKERCKWFANHIRMLIYRKDPEPYNPEGTVVSEQKGEKKMINTSLLEKGHQYAGLIVKELKQKTPYNSKYWLSLIREQKDGNVIKRIIQRTRRMLKKDNADNL